MEYRLEEIFDLQMGKTPSRNNPDYWNTTDNKWISIADLSKCGKYIESTKEYLSEQAVEESGISQIPANTVVMSFKLSIGKTAITPEPMYSNEAIMSFRDKMVVDILPDYIFYMFSGKDWDEGTNKAVMGKTLNKATLSKIKVNIPDIKSQQKAVEVLDKVSGIIAARKSELEKLDELIKARFVELFGNPVTNDKGWDTDSCKNLMSKIGSGATPKGGRESYCEEGISLIRSMNVYNNRFEYKDLAHITEEQAKQLDNVTIEEDDILLNITGASVARCCVVPCDLLPARVNQHVSIIRCKERVMPDFVCCMFTEDNYQRLLWNIATAGGATREAITKQQLEELTLIVPPIDLQKQFIEFVKQVDKSKFTRIYFVIDYEKKKH